MTETIVEEIKGERIYNLLLDTRQGRPVRIKADVMCKVSTPDGEEEYVKFKRQGRVVGEIHEKITCWWISED